jgi:signal transduction histidine kinase
MTEESILEKVNRLAFHFLEQLELQDVYREVIRQATALTGSKDGAIYLEKEGLFETVYGSTAAIRKVRPRKKGFAYEVFRKQRTLVIYPPAITDTDFNLAHPELKKNFIKTVVFIPLSYHKKAFGVVVIRLVEKRKFTEADLDALEILGSMAMLSIRKAELMAQTKKALETRDLFMSMAAHELKTPMTVISGYTQLLQSKFQNNPGPELRWVANLSNEVSRMNRLINELLMINQIKSGKFQYVWKTCSIKNLLLKSIDTLRFKSPKRKILFHEALEEEDDAIVGDEDKLAQVFDNLLDNAEKFSELNQPIVVNLLRKDGFFEVEIKDKGIGIKKKDLPYVFEEFYQSQKSGTYPGMGLGLFLVRSIVLHHRGKIHAHSERGSGTTFCVELPAVKSWS